MYVLRNGRPEWLAKLKDVLQADAHGSGLDAWKHIGTSRDLHPRRKQQHDAQTMEIAVAQHNFLGILYFYFF